MLVLLEAKEDDGNISGFTENYVRVNLPFSKTLINQMVPVKIEGVDSDGIATATVLTKVVS
jgi:threonylcarbamoyladenosine tRNA methylthiotransferase MtaB